MTTLTNLTLKIWRQDGPDGQGRFETHQIPEISDEASFLEMLDILNERLIEEGKEAIVFDHDCREGICGCCGAMVNGLAHGGEAGTTLCQLHMRSFSDGDEIFVTSGDLRSELGDAEFEKLPTGALGLYTYYERLAQGLAVEGPDARPHVDPPSLECRNEADRHRRAVFPGLDLGLGLGDLRLRLGDLGDGRVRRLLRRRLGRRTLGGVHIHEQVFTLKGDGPRG